MAIHKLAPLFAALVLIPSEGQAAPQGITYDCDTAANHYSELILPAPAGRFVVKGTVQLMQMAAADQFVPLTRLVIADAPDAPGKSPREGGGFSLSALPAKAIGIKSKKKDEAVQFINWRKIENAKVTDADLILLANDARIVPFTVTYDGSTVRSRVEGQETASEHSLQNPVVQIVCSTGEYLYTNLVIEPLG